MEEHGTEIGEAVVIVGGGGMETMRAAVWVASAVEVAVMTACWLGRQVTVFVGAQAM